MRLLVEVVKGMAKFKQRKEDGDDQNSRGIMSALRAEADRTYRSHIVENRKVFQNDRPINLFIVPWCNRGHHGL